MHRWLFLSLLVACSSANRDWRAAKRAGTAEAYRPIANDFSHPKRAKAYARVERLDWERGSQEGSSRAWKAYLSHHPNSPRGDEARRNRDEARWSEVRKADSRTTYEAWLAMNGGSSHVAEARQRIEDLAWKEATLADTPEAYARYLVRNPRGPYAEEARIARQARFWEAAKTSDRPADYRVFVERFPDGPFSDEARAVIEGFRFSGVAVRIVGRKLLRGDSLAAYRTTLKDTLIPGLEGVDLATAWLDPVKADGPAAVNPLAGLLTTVPEDHAALVIEVRERRGAALEPSGHAVDIEATVHLVPPGRMDAMEVREVEASTQYLGADQRGNLLDAQRHLGAVILASDLGFETWRR